MLCCHLQHRQQTERVLQVSAPFSSPEPVECPECSLDGVPAETRSPPGHLGEPDFLGGRWGDHLLWGPGSLLHCLTFLFAGA